MMGLDVNPILVSDIKEVDSDLPLIDATSYQQKTLIIYVPF